MTWCAELHRMGNEKCEEEMRNSGMLLKLPPVCRCVAVKQAGVVDVVESHDAERVVQPMRPLGETGSMIFVSQTTGFM